MTACRALQDRPAGLSIAAMGEDATNHKGAQRDKRRQRLAAALRRNLKRRKAQLRGRTASKPGGQPAAGLPRASDADGD